MAPSVVGGGGRGVLEEGVVVVVIDQRNRSPNAADIDSERGAGEQLRLYAMRRAK